MSSQISPPDWPKRPKLVYTNDYNRVAICLDFETAGTPKSKVYHVSKLLHKIFDKQDPRVVDSHNLDFQELAAPPGVDDEVFCHIVQCVDTGSIIIPSQLNNDTLPYPCRKCTLVSLERSYRNGLSLSTLAHIWYLAGYLRMPHCQNIAIDHIYHLLSHIVAHSHSDNRFYDENPFMINELTHAIRIADKAKPATGISSTSSAFRALLGQFFACHSSYRKWTPGQRKLVSKRFLGDAMCHLQDNNEWLRGVANLELEADCIQDANMAKLGCYFMADEIDGGNAEEGLDESFDFNRDLLRRKPIQVLFL
ncbi:hypothetical protein BCON_0059g00340 [Botryotinia convoluta]|uniref:Uncharacterized protein n=1 Tax=Botryotinia convoluta TaxID=54673 RepID=A0A4Z1I9V3_9HELO|nr:hypothetical protein BCON_0059g00340 [Botryotinia convoluta]